MSILVAYGSKQGGTAGLAEMVADALRREGFTVEVAPASAQGRVEGYEAVIVGGALYAFRWHRDARRFIRRHTHVLCNIPTYFFSSGPLDASASERDIAPIRSVRALMDRVGARGHATFGGRLTSDARGFLAHLMAKRNAGHWRDPTHVQSWTHAIAADLRAPLRKDA